MLSIKEVCQYVGGQAKLAKFLNISTSAVNQWVLGRRPIPARFCPEIERFSQGRVKCEDLRPDINWAFLRDTKLVDQNKIVC
ncbi:MAG: helix-turn-helix domain-containing protein [Nitrosomonas sp.]|nr:helix-turn-helix domain-containing protein [Nitrosomonas sp.]